MNRENKRKQYEKGFFKTHPCNDTFTCKACGRLVTPEGAGTVFILGGPDEVKTVSKSDYEQWLADTMGNPAELDIPYQALSEENITSLN